MLGELCWSYPSKNKLSKEVFKDPKNCHGLTTSPALSTLAVPPAPLGICWQWGHSRFPSLLPLGTIGASPTSSLWFGDPVVQSCSSSSPCPLSLGLGGVFLLWGSQGAVPTFTDPGESDTEGWRGGKNGVTKPGKCFPLEPGCPGSQPQVVAASWLFSPSVIKDGLQFHHHEEFLLREQDRQILTELLLPRRVLCPRTSYFHHPFTTLFSPSSPFPTWLQTNLEISISATAPNF